MCTHDIHIHVLIGKMTYIYIYIRAYIYIFLVRIIYKIYLTGHRSIVKLDEFHDSLLFKASIIDLIITKYIN